MCGKTRDYDQQRVHVTNQRQQTRIERGAFLLFFWIGCEVDDREFDRDFLFRAVGGFQKIQARIGDLDLAWTCSIFALGGAGHWGEAGQGVKDSRFSGAAGTDDSGFHFSDDVQVAC